MIIDNKVNKDYAALMLTEILFEKGLINKETYFAVKKKLQKDPHISQDA